MDGRVTSRRNNRVASAGGSELRLLTQSPRVRSLHPDEQFSLTQFDDFQTTRADIRTEPFQHRQSQELFRKPVIKSECLRLSHPHVTRLDGVDRLMVGLQRVPLRHSKALRALPVCLWMRAGTRAGVASAPCVE